MKHDAQVCKRSRLNADVRTLPIRRMLADAMSWVLNIADCLLIARHTDHNCISSDTPE
jgi:hypothetical protein